MTIKLENFDTLMQACVESKPKGGQPYLSIDLTFITNNSGADWSDIQEEVGKWIVAHCPTVEKLRLEESEITEIPEWIGNLSHLRSLSFFGNEISYLPEYLGNLKNLKKLNLSGNLLSALPEWLDQLTELETLDVSGNALHTFPLVVSRLSNLQELDISGNHIQQWPQKLTVNPTLKIDITNNPVTYLPGMENKDIKGTWQAMNALFTPKQGTKRKAEPNIKDITMENPFRIRVTTHSTTAEGKPFSYWVTYVSPTVRTKHFPTLLQHIVQEKRVEPTPSPENNPSAVLSM